MEGSCTDNFVLLDSRPCSVHPTEACEFVDWVFEIYFEEIANVNVPPKSGAEGDEASDEDKAWAARAFDDF